MNIYDVAATAIAAGVLWDAARRFTEARMAPAQVRAELSAELCRHKDELSGLFEAQRADLATQIRDAAQARAMAPSATPRRRVNLTGSSSSSAGRA